MDKCKRRFDSTNLAWCLMGFIGLGAAWWGLHDSSHAQSQVHQLQSQIESQHRTISLQTETIKQYQKHFELSEAEFYSLQVSLSNLRSIAGTYKKDRDLNWSRYQHYQDLYDQCRVTK